MTLETRIPEPHTAGKVIFSDDYCEIGEVPSLYTPLELQIQLGSFVGEDPVGRVHWQRICGTVFAGPASARLPPQYHERQCKGHFVVS